jgi:hypothetical protein
LAYTKSPSQDTYSTEEIDITKEIVTRQGGVLKDEDYVNVFLEEIKNKATGDKRSFVVKRSGSAGLLASIASGTIRGSAYWEDQQKLFYAIAGNVYIYNFGTGTTTTLTPSPWTSTSTTVGFAEFIYNNGTTAILLSDGTNLIQIDSSNAITYCVDPDLPTPHDPNLIFIDGYILLAKTGTSDFYNSDNNAPLSWTAGNFLSAEIEASTIKRLFKISNYIVAATEETLEYFWDAGIATGSPFQRNDTPVKRISFLGAAAQDQNTTYFIGKELNAGYQVYKMYDFKCDPIGSQTICRFLNTVATNYTSWVGNIITYQGHKFYVINVGGTLTYCMDLDTGLWTRLAYQANSTFNIARAHGLRTTSSNSSIFALNDGTSAWYIFNEAQYQDNGINYTCQITTDSCDFGTLNKKSMSRVSLYVDRPSADSYILIQWSDDDYQTFNTGQLVNLNQDLCCARQLGNFRQRSFKLTYTDNALLRIQGMVADINKGSS